MLKLDNVKSDTTHVSATQISSLDNSRMAINKSEIAATTLNRHNDHHAMDSKAGDLEHKGKSGVADQGRKIGVNRFFRNSKSKIAVAADEDQVKKADAKVASMWAKDEINNNESKYRAYGFLQIVANYCG